MRRQDRGAVAAMTGLALVPILLVCAVVVDGGRVFVDRQRAQTAAEAGALAGAAAWARGDVACGPAVDATVASNAGGDATADCSVLDGLGGGRVDVAVGLPVATFFSGLLGRDSTTVTSQAAVRLGGASGVRGLRPLGLCVNDEAVRQWIDSGFEDEGEKRISSEQVDGPCGPGVSGNWATLDFSGGSNSQTKIREWVLNGYPEEIKVPSTVEGAPGTVSTSLRLDNLVGQTVAVPLYERAYLVGANARFDIVSFALITVLEVKVTGNDQFLRFRFQKGLVTGSCCVSDQLNTGVLVSQICRLDNTEVCSE